MEDNFKIDEKIKDLIKETLESLGVEVTGFVVEHPGDLSHGDYSTNVALILAKKSGKNPKELAEEIVQYIERKKSAGIEKIEIAGVGFINFYLSKEFFKKSISEIIEQGSEFGKNENLKGEKVMVEYTDPNPFKEFHIGHLMSNVIGESLAGLFEYQNAIVKRVNWEGDVGIHVAKAIWGIKQEGKAMNVTTTSDFGKAYALGSRAYEEDDQARKEIIEINNKIYRKSDPALNAIYEVGRQISLDSFEEMYKRLGTKFSYYFFESKEGVRGKPIVEEFLQKGVFEKSDGAIIFRGERYGLHTRVFINAQGLPTYEAKELGLNKEKFEIEPDLSQSIIVTGNEIKDYFKVLMQVMSLIFPNIAEKTKHIPHGMLRLSSGKMSSRTGNVITAEELIGNVKEKVKDNEQVAIGAIKYMILRQAIGNDIIFDIEKSVSTEGDSGVYLQYAYARTNSLMERAKNQGATLILCQDDILTERNTREVERLLYRFPEVIERAGQEYAPHYIVTYLTELAGSFNHFYAHEQIINDSPESPYRLAIAKAFNIVMKNGLTILGIPTPERI